MDKVLKVARELQPHKASSDVNNAFYNPSGQVFDGLVDMNIVLKASSTSSTSFVRQGDVAAMDGNAATVAFNFFKAATYFPF